MAAAAKTLEERIRAIEDRLEIYNLIAAHPPSADTASSDFAASFWMEDGVSDMNGTVRSAREMTGFDSPAFQTALLQGIAHFTGLPHIRLMGDKAVATSYLQVLAPDHVAAPDPLSAHPPPEGAQGYRIHRLSANRWDLVRTPQGWKIARRTLRLIEGKERSRVVLRGVTEAADAGP
jgi:hypothetical protein